MKPMHIRERLDLVDTLKLDPHHAPIHFFELDGTPSDTMIVAFDGGINHLCPEANPKLVVSGINLGPNMSQDAYHSGTMGAAREAGLYGMPAIATSFTSFEETGHRVAVDATIQCVEKVWSFLPTHSTNVGRPLGAHFSHFHSSWPNSGSQHDLETQRGLLRQAFEYGDLMLNVNVPPHWNGKWQATRLGVRWYRNAVTFSEAGSGEDAMFTIGAASVDYTPVDYGDCDAVEALCASVSCLPVWPETHPFCLDRHLLASAVEDTIDGWPAWMVKH